MKAIFILLFALLMLPIATNACPGPDEIHPYSSEPGYQAWIVGPTITHNDPANGCTLTIDYCYRYISSGTGAPIYQTCITHWSYNKGCGYNLDYLKYLMEEYMRQSALNPGAIPGGLDPCTYPNHIKMEMHMPACWYVTYVWDNGVPKAIVGHDFFPCCTIDPLDCPDEPHGYCVKACDICYEPGDPNHVPPIPSRVNQSNCTTYIIGTISCHYDGDNYFPHNETGNLALFPNDVNGAEDGHCYELDCEFPGQ